jgi:hypothetical protein
MKNKHLTQRVLLPFDFLLLSGFGSKKRRDAQLLFQMK